VGWHVERAVLPTGRVTWLVVEDELYASHREVREYVAALEAADRSPDTIKTYLPAIAMFLTWCKDSGVDWRVINLLQLARFKRALEDAPGRSGLPRAASSVSIQLTAMCEFLRYCASVGHVDPEVAHRLVETRWVHPAAYRSDGEQGQFRRVRTSALRVDRPELPPEVLSDDQVAAMRDAASCARDRFLLRVLHDRGTHRRMSRSSDRRCPLAA
jgi:integrase/recombinase XerD